MVFFLRSCPKEIYKKKKGPRVEGLGVPKEGAPNQRNPYSRDAHRKETLIPKPGNLILSSIHSVNSYICSTKNITSDTFYYYHHEDSYYWLYCLNCFVILAENPTMCVVYLVVLIIH